MSTNGDFTPAPNRDVSSAFGTRPKLQKRAPRPTKPADEATATANAPKTPAQADAPTPATAPAPAAAPRTPAKKKREGITAYLPSSLAKQLKATAVEHSWSNGMVLVQAMAATHAQLPDLVRDDLGLSTDVDDAAALWQMPATSVTHAREETKEVFFSGLNAAQISALNDLTASSGARNRTHLITVALRTFLTQKG